MKLEKRLLRRSANFYKRQNKVLPQNESPSAPSILSAEDFSAQARTRETSEKQAENPARNLILIQRLKKLPPPGRPGNRLPQEDRQSLHMNQILLWNGDHNSRLPPTHPPTRAHLQTAKAARERISSMEDPRWRGYTGRLTQSQKAP
jgi:hypothetical protein